MTARDAVVFIRERLKTAGISEPEAKAKLIVSHALGCGLPELNTSTQITADAEAEIARMTMRCAAGEPVEYVTGKAYFRYLDLDVSPAVLIPRNETELVVGCAIQLIKDNSYSTAADICTGSGCIAISLATETNVSVTATDISEKALETAKNNGIQNSASIEFILSDMFQDITDSYDIIVCNPPYVSESEYIELDESVRLYEPRLALAAGDGLEFYRRIATDGPGHINKGGALVLEIGCGQARDVTEILKLNGFSDIECIKDYEGRDRIISARVD